MTKTFDFRPNRVIDRFYAIFGLEAGSGHLDRLPFNLDRLIWGHFLMIGAKTALLDV